MYIKINIIQMLLSYVFLFGVSKDERPEGSDADLDFLPLETESETSCSDDSELSNIVEDLSFVMDSPPRSETWRSQLFGRDDVPSGQFTYVMILYTHEHHTLSDIGCFNNRYALS